MIKTIPLIDLPYPAEGLRSGMSDLSAQKARDKSLSLLKGQTNLLRLATDFSDSYASTDKKTLLHYRDYLIAEAVLASLKSTLYTSADRTELTQRSERVFSTKDFSKLWPLVAQEGLEEDSILYAGPPGSPAFYFLMADIADEPLTALERLTAVVWNLHGIGLQEAPAGRLDSIKGYLGDLPRLEEQLKTAVLKAYAPGALTEEEELAKKNLLQHFVVPEDYAGAANQILYGGWNDEQMSLALSLLPEDQRKDIIRSMAFSDSIGKGAGINLLLQTLAVEGFLKAAKAIDSRQEFANEGLDRFLQEEGYAQDLKTDVAAALDLTASAYFLLEASSMYSDVIQEASRAYNSALRWLGSSGLEALPEEGFNDLRSFANALFSEAFVIPELSKYSSAIADSEILSSLQGRPGKGLDAFLQFPKPYDDSASPSVDKGPYTLARLKAEEGLDGNASIDTGNLDAFVLHDGPQTELSLSEYNALDAVSNVAVVQTGLPAVDLSPSLNAFLNRQTLSYETINTLHNAPRPRGLVGYDEMIRGMVSYLFRDAPSDEAANKVKVDGSREEHTSRVAGLLTQLKSVHLNSEIPTISTWTKFVEEVL